MKKLIPFIVLAVLAAACLAYHCIGWFRGELSEYIMENYTCGAQTVTDCEYISRGEDEQGEFIIYRLTAEDGSCHYVRVQVVFHRYINKIGPDFKIKQIIPLPDYTPDNIKNS